MATGATTCCLTHLENAGSRGWFPEDNPHRAEGYLAVFVDGVKTGAIKLETPVHSQCRNKFVFDVTAPEPSGSSFRVRLQLLAEHQSFSEKRGIVVFDGGIQNTDDPSEGRTNAKSAFAGPPILPSYGCTWTSLELPASWPENEVARSSVSVANTGTRTWHVRRETENPVDLAVFRNGERRTTIPLPRPLSTGESAESQFSLPAPDDHAIRKVRAVLLEQNLAWFDQHGVRPWIHQIPATAETALAGYAVDWVDDSVPERWPVGAAFQVYLQIRNVGSRTWWADPDGGTPMQMAVFLDGKMQHLVSLKRHLLTGDEELLTFRLTFPGPPEGQAGNIRFALVEQNVAWFHDQGASDLVRTVIATPAQTGPTAEAMAICIATNWAFWLPAECIMQSRTGRAYPSIMKEAQGCRVRDFDGNEWIDMVMAGGSAMLDYANPRTQEAIAAELHSSAIMTLPQVLELEVSRMLQETIPSAEMVLFGKHGSDACTLAVRLA